MSALAASQPGAGQRSARTRLPVQTVATVRGHVLGFAQDDRYLGWLLPGPPNQFGAGNVGVVVMDDLRTGAKTKTPSNPNGYWPGPPRGLAVAGDRAYWEQIGATQNTTDADLVTASIRHRKQLQLASEESTGDIPLLPPVGDGTNVYFWSSSDPDFVGPVARYDSLKRRRVTTGIGDPAALAAGGGRFARAVHTHDNAGAPVWSPDGKQIAFTRTVGSSHQLWLVNADGTNEHMIAGKGTDPNWSHDGTKLAYGGPGNSIIVSNADGTDPQRVTSGTDPAWSPGGRKLAVVDQGGIWTVAPDGTDRTLVIKGGSAPDWSPNGRDLVYVGPGGTVAVAGADGSDPHTIATPDSDSYGPSPAWSPDGTEIAFVSLSCGDGFDTVGICDMHPDGTDEQTVVGDDSGDYYQPAWGPTNSSLVSVSSEWVYGDGDPHIVVWPDMRQVTGPPPEMSIIVSTRDGRQVAQLESSGPVKALAVSRRVVAASISDAGRPAIEIYQPTPRIVPLAGSPGNKLAISGTTLVFQVGHTIETLDGLKGSPRPVARTASYAIGLSVVGRRIAWAENGAHGAQIRELELP
jgi:Tol biopolymer transport system component